MKTFILILLLSLNTWAGFTTASGRITDPNGNGLTNAQVYAQPAPVSPCPEWLGAIGPTNPFGYYTVEVPNDCSFLLFPTSRTYTDFEPPNLIFTIEEGTDGPFFNVDFQGVD